MSTHALSTRTASHIVGSRTELERKLESTGPGRILAWGWRTFGSRMVLGTGFGTSGMVLIHLLDKLDYRVPVFFWIPDCCSGRPTR